MQSAYVSACPTAVTPGCATTPNDHRPFAFFDVNSGRRFVANSQG